MKAYGGSPPPFDQPGLVALLKSKTVVDCNGGGEGGEGGKGGEGGDGGEDGDGLVDGDGESGEGAGDGGGSIYGEENRQPLQWTCTAEGKKTRF